ncbi:acyl carrier protein [Colwellia sp. D2M02]|uniref:Carrier domain-containing protein n=1 Tax=Colwellia asteriadis TaxID=517723 RepID=A0ABN1LBR4_9GAMM|nr:acyl carrier protein [Colwellia sp. D2M02]MBU2895016.1 acyl carrier protein [Colwellia sp. D2M02]
MNLSQISQQLITLLSGIIPSYEKSFWHEQTELFGAIAEFDSMVIVTLIGEIEEQFDVVLDDDDISAENFESVASLSQLIYDNIDG